MPIEGEAIDDAKVVVSTVFGALSVDEIVDYFGSVWSSERYAGYSELFDLRRVTGTPPTLASLRSVAGAAHALFGSDERTKLAIVAQGDENLRLAQAYKTFRDLRAERHSEIRVFSEIGEACRWLGLADRD